MTEVSKRPQTITREKYEREVLTFERPLFGEKVDFHIQATIPSRTYEDRDVYFAINQSGTSLRAEDAIKLGQALIENGTRSMLANMYQHQHIHHESSLQRYISEDRVEKVIFTLIDEEVANCAPDWKIYSIKPVWVEGMTPEYSEDFEFESIINWSPLEDEFQQQTGYWKVPVEIVGYDREAEVEKWNEWVKQQEAIQQEIAMDTSVGANQEEAVEVSLEIMLRSMPVQELIDIVSTGQKILSEPVEESEVEFTRDETLDLTLLKEQVEALPSTVNEGQEQLIEYKEFLQEQVDNMPGTLMLDEEKVTKESKVEIKSEPKELDLELLKEQVEALPTAASWVDEN
jgi:hypothetical protein